MKENFNARNPATNKLIYKPERVKIRFKASKKFLGKGYRVFLMAPLHHHFELQGKKEIESAIGNKTYVFQ